MTSAPPVTSFPRCTGRQRGKDGRVSIEVDPRLARDAAATADMARALRSAVDRDNMFVKIPATPEGLTAITQVTSEGISVNVTLIFALARYRAVMDAYLSGLEQAAAAGLDPCRHQLSRLLLHLPGGHRGRHPP